MYDYVNVSRQMLRTGHTKTASFLSLFAGSGDKIKLLSKQITQGYSRILPECVRNTTHLLQCTVYSL